MPFSHAEPSVKLSAESFTFLKGILSITVNRFCLKTAANGGISLLITNPHQAKSFNSMIQMPFHAGQK
jgi:hypothetical protein